MSWKIVENESDDRTRQWYITSIVIGILLLIYCVWTANFLFGMIIFIIAVIYYFQKIRETKKIDFIIFSAGIQIGDQMIPYKDIKSFFIIYEPPAIKQLYFQLKSGLFGRVSIPLGDINPIKVREILLDYIDEDLEAEDEPLSDSMGRMFKL